LEQVVQTAHHPLALIPDVGVALGQKTEDLGVVGRLDGLEPRSTQSGQGNREGIVRIVLVRPGGGEHPDSRRQRRRHVEDLFTAGHELLGQQVAETSGGLDGPSPLLEGLGPFDELIDLSSGGAHSDARELHLGDVDGHRGVRGLVRVDADHHLHEYLLGRVGTTEGTPACSWFVLDPLLSHSVAKPGARSLSFDSQPAHADGRHFESDPAGTSEPYESAAGSAGSLKQALMGWLISESFNGQRRCGGVRRLSRGRGG
jgi:hypothetical protein